MLVLFWWYDAGSDPIYHEIILAEASSQNANVKFGKQVKWKIIASHYVLEEG